MLFYFAFISYFMSNIKIATFNFREENRTDKNEHGSGHRHRAQLDSSL